MSLRHISDMQRIHSEKSEYKTEYAVLFQREIENL